MVAAGRWPSFSASAAQINLNVHVHALVLVLDGVFAPDGAGVYHPHIAQVYGVEETDGTRALVMEYVDGETLADRIARGPIPVDDALPMARQIADALDAAHERRIISP